MTEQELKAQAELEKAKEVEGENNPDNWDPIDAKEHQKVVRESMKRKQEASQLRDELAQIKAEREALQMADLEAKQEWEKVAKLNATKYQELLNERNADRQGMVDSHKKAAVIQATGGFVKASYADMAINLENIAMIDGVIDQDTLDHEVERIQREESALLKKSAGSGLPSGAPDQNANVDTKDYNNMTELEKDSYFRSILTKK